MSWNLKSLVINKAVYVSLDDLIIGFLEDKDDIEDENVKITLSNYVKEFKKVRNNEI